MEGGGERSRDRCARAASVVSLSGPVQALVWVTGEEREENRDWSAAAMSSLSTAEDGRRSSRGVLSGCELGGLSESPLGVMLF